MGIGPSCIWGIRSLPLILSWTYLMLNVKFLERTGFPADISSRVAWKFRGRAKVQKHVGSAGVAINAKQERIKRVYPPLKMRIVVENFF